MSQPTHPFGDLLSQHLHRKHGLSQAKLAEGMLQEPSVITEMCKGRRLTGPQARERVLAIIGWLQKQGALTTLDEADALLAAAGMAALNGNTAEEKTLRQRLAKPTDTNNGLDGLHSLVRTNNLPLQATLFVGRAKELTEIAQQLADPNCRLLSLLGPGGVGKSRLSIEAVRQLAAHAISHDAHFVPLASVDSSDGMVTAIAHALQFNFYSDVPAREQLLGYLQEKQLLMILDNFEQLMAGAPLLAEMLAAAPGLKLIVTSREALNLQEEWLYRVEGLSLSAGDSADNNLSEVASDALQLFAQCAKRVRVDFGSAHDYVNAQRICALVEGMPLGIELAASWLRTLPGERIAHEIERNLDILSTRLQNVPERHRSLRAAFEHSWQRLTEAEQQAFMRLSVLRGFDIEAAQQVSDATLAVLAVLVDKSLLRVTTTGRYQMHALLQQLAEEKLYVDRTLHAEILAKHSKYFLAFIAESERHLLGEQQVRALDELAKDSDNCRIAWDYAVQQEDWAAIDSALNGLYWFYEMRTRFVEGETAFGLAAQALRRLPAARPALLGRVLARQGAFAIMAEDYAAAEKVLSEASTLARSSEDLAEVAFVLNRQGQLEERQGKWRAAIAILEQSLHLSERIGDERSMAETLFEMANVYSAGVGGWHKVFELEQRTLELSRKLKLSQQTAYALEGLGTCLLFLGRYAEAKAYYEESLPMFRELGDWLGYAKALNGLGGTIAESDPTQWRTGVQYQAESIVLLRKLGQRRQLSMHLKTISGLLIDAGQFQQAQSYITESLAISTELNDPIRVSFGHVTLAKINIGLKGFALAKQHTRRGLFVSHTADLPEMTSWLLTLWVQIRVNENAGCVDESKEDECVHFLTLLYVAVKDRVSRDVLNVGEPLIARLETELPAERVAEAKVRSATLSLKIVVDEILQSSDAPTI